MVFVLDRQGRPLMPCHPARARELLRKGRAVVARHTPFAIRLKDRRREESEVPGVAVRLDPGSKSTGIAVTGDVTRVDARTGDVSTARRGLYAIELQHRGERIRKGMMQRANHRHRRRSANLRYRTPRFNNRARPRGWLPPSLRHRVDTSLSQVRRLARLAPVTEVHVAWVAFDTHSLSVEGDLEGVEYQQGTLAGYEVRQYLLEKWGRACVYCGATGVPLQIEHVQPRARGGSNRISNLTLACEPCNEAKGARPIEEFLQRRPTTLEKIRSQAKTPLRDAAAMNSTRWQLGRGLRLLGPPVVAWSGGRTKYNRANHRLGKTHTLDALAVGEVPDDCRIVRYAATVLVTAATGRGTYSRTRADKYGFPRLALTRSKSHHGYATGDLVRAVVPTGKHTGTHIGRVAVRASGKFTIRTAVGLIQNIHHRHLRLLQRGDGYGYTFTREEAH